MTTTDAAPLQTLDQEPPSARRTRFGQPRLILALTAVISLVVIVVCVVLNSGGVGISDVFRTLYLELTGGTIPAQFEAAHNIVWDLRMPRVLLAFAGGAALSVAGVLLQGLLRNPLVSPFTLGISPAAAFGAAVVILVSTRSGTSTFGLEVPAALVAALLCALVVVSLGSARGMGPATLILLGIALTQLFEALTATMQYIADENALAAIVRWTFGSVNNAQWHEVAIMLVLLAISLPYLQFRAKDINAVAFAGDEVATSLGVNVPRLRAVLIAVSVTLTATIVSFAGIIGFVGLVGPHIARLLIGGNHRYLIPMSTMTGGLLLAGSDLVGRTILAPIVVPVGIVVAFVGVPIFINLVLSRRTIG